KVKKTVKNRRVKTKTVNHSLKIFFLLFGALSAIVLFIYFSPLRPYFLSQQQTSTNTETSSFDTSNWKTYINTQYGFSFKYPANYFIYESNDPNGNIDTTTISNYDHSDFSSGRKNSEDKDVFLMYVTHPWQKDVSLEKIKKYYGNYLIQDYKVDGITGFRATRNEKVGINNFTVVIIKNNKEYYFTLGAIDSRYADVFNQILSTFKFL
ncbi:hypothetical protein C4577_04370, partial [Candidatus Parcubacteria bacterium]